MIIFVLVLCWLLMPSSPAEVSDHLRRNDKFQPTQEEERHRIIEPKWNWNQPVFTPTMVPTSTPSASFLSVQCTEGRRPVHDNHSATFRISFTSTGNQKTFTIFGFGGTELKAYLVYNAEIVGSTPGFASGFSQLEFEANNASINFVDAVVEVKGSTTPTSTPTDYVFTLIPC